VQAVRSPIECAKVAQSVEHAPEKCGVAGSIPALGTTTGRFRFGGASSTFTLRRRTADNGFMSRFYRAAGTLLLAFLMVSPLGATAAASLHAGSDVSYAPLEFFGKGGKMRGFDIDLARALSTALQRPIVIENDTFSGLLAAVESGRLDLAISAISDTRAREKHVDFIDYLLAGSGMLVPAGNPKHVFSLAGLCGLRVDVQRGTSQETALEQQSQDCKNIHLAPITLLTYPTDDEAFAAFAQGKSDVHVTDFPVIVYLAKTHDHLYAVAGRQFDLVPYGIAVSKSNPALLAQLVSALKQVIANGTYDALLRKWGLEQGALRSAPVNAGTLFSK
jgi:polar amino acid transport system substrate-binding protein